MTKGSSSHCSFCDIKEEEAKLLFKSDLDAQEEPVYICDRCLEAGFNVLENAKPHGDLALNLLKPKEVYSHLSQYIIGQEKAKKIISVAVYNHYKRLISQHSDDLGDSVEIQKSNVLLVGPTGSGKTLIAQTLAKILHVPFAVADATTLTEAGYVGEDVESVLHRLIQVADDDIEKAERGIIYIDEVDKISRRGENRSITRDVSGEGVQQALLKMLEGTVVNVSASGGRKHPQDEFIKINTKDILFICGGAFDGIDDIIAKRKDANIIGFIEKKEESIMADEDVETEDLISFGLIPELVGRLPVVTSLTQLTEEQLVDILTTPKNALVKQYEKLLEMDEIKLTFEEDALKLIAKLALKKKMGARALRSITESLMMEHMFELPSKKSKSKKLVVDEKMVKKKFPYSKNFANDAA
jgi:ATP-dependent Clp protease ATP-binding subunit ClpX